MSDSLMMIELKEAFQSRQCPLCCIRRKAEDRYLWFYVREYTNDGATVMRLCNSYGFCRSHAWRAKAMHEEEWDDGLGIATTYGYLLDALTAELERLAKHPPLEAGPRHRKRKVVPLAQKVECPACEIGQRNEQSAARILLDALETNERGMQKHLAASPLCLRHLRLALTEACSLKSVSILLAIEINHLRTLRAEIDTYIHKQTHEGRNEPKGAEQDRLDSRAGILCWS